MKKEKLHKIAPKLSEISPTKTGFKIPENYFDSIEYSVIAELNAQNFQNKKTNKPFKTPENYFDSIEDLVFTKLKAEALQNNSTDIVPENYFETIEDKILTKITSSSKVILLKNRFAKIVAPIAIAASLLLIFVLNNNSNKITFDTLTTAEIETWINNGNIDIDAVKVASIYPDIELTNDTFSSSLTNNEVLEYLSTEDLEELIYEN